MIVLDLSLFKEKLFDDVLVCLPFCWCPCMAINVRVQYDCVADDLRLFGVTGDWKTAALDPGAWYNTVQEGGCRFMAAWVREEENASNQRQKKRDAEEADKVEVAPGVTVALKTFSNRVDWANPRTP